MRVYLAGPDVFLPNPYARGETLKAICAAHALAGVFPLDPLDDEPQAWSALPEWRRIALRNEAHLRAASGVIANLTPFRGPSADPGTVFELGFARALGLPVFAWSEDRRPFTQRTLAWLGGAASPDALLGGWRDGEGMAVEAFGCTDNLMIDGAVASSGGAILLPPPPAGAVADAAAGLDPFRRCVAAASRLLLAGAGPPPQEPPP